MANHKHTTSEFIKERPYREKSACESLDEKRHLVSARQQMTIVNREYINEKYFNALRILMNSSEDYDTFFQSARILIDNYEHEQKVFFERKKRDLYSFLNAQTPFLAFQRGGVKINN